MSDVELRPCPFCGDSEVGFDQGFMRCEECGAEGPPTSTGNRPRAEQTWNTRPEEDRLRSALQVAEQRNQNIVAETWKLGTEIEERAIEQARLREALQVAERERDGARAELERDQEFMVRVAQERDEARANVGELRAEVERLRGALAWYADPNQWNGYYGNTDNGKRAREALGK